MRRAGAGRTATASHRASENSLQDFRGESPRRAWAAPRHPFHVLYQEVGTAGSPSRLARSTSSRDSRRWRFDNVDYICNIRIIPIHGLPALNLTIAELARAVGKSETYVRQHIHRKHLIAQKEGRSVYVEFDEAARWAHERGLSFDLSARALMTADAVKGRTARMTVLVWNVSEARPRNLFTLIRHRRQEALGPWASEPDGTWSSSELGKGLQLFSCDAPFERCEALVEQILDSGVLEIDGIELDYALESIPRCHWAYRDGRPLARASVRSPFSRHSAKIIEYWSFAAKPHECWMEILESPPTNLSHRLSRLGFPLDRRPDRAGNLMIAGAEDAIACSLAASRDRTLRFHIDGDELPPGAYRATVWASHSGDDVLRREVLVTLGQMVIELDSEVDHIGFEVIRTADGQCVDLMEVFLIMDIGVNMTVDSGPTLHFHDRRNRLIHKIKAANVTSKLNIRADNDDAVLDREIRQQWLYRQSYEQESATRREGNFRRFQPTEFYKAVLYFISILRQDSDQKTPIYLADPYFMAQLKGNKGTKLYLELFTNTIGTPLRILCVEKNQQHNPQPWWSSYPKAITAHVSVRAFLNKHHSHMAAFHDRYLITPRREIIITHSINGWSKDGVTFARLPFNVYRTDAERLWSIDVKSGTSDLLVREIG